MGDMWPHNALACTHREHRAKIFVWGKFWFTVQFDTRKQQPLKTVEPDFLSVSCLHKAFGEFYDLSGIFNQQMELPLSLKTPLAVAHDRMRQSPRERDLFSSTFDTIVTLYLIHTAASAAQNTCKHTICSSFSSQAYSRHFFQEVSSLGVLL